MNTVSNRIVKILQLIPEGTWYVPLTPFERLVSTILSQNTSREATIQGFENLRKRFQVVPAVLADAGVEEIKECIRPSGLYNIKAPRIKQLARIILVEYGGDLNYFANLPLDVARERLLQIPGVGYKTADVFLSIVCGRERFAVDTHIGRIARRWKMVSDDAGYEHIRLAYEAVIPPEKRQAAHLCLIEFGRQLCRARVPRCHVCPLYPECEWPSKSEYN